MRVRMMLVAIAAVSVSGCNQHKQAASATPEAGRGVQVGPTLKAASEAVRAVPVDNSTPDRALKTLWGLEDAAGTAYCAAEHERDLLSQSGRLAEMSRRGLGNYPQLESLTAGNVAEHVAYMNDARCVPDVYSREITEVRQETDTRAVARVTVKNVTPIPEGAEPDDYDKKARKNGTQYRYVFTKGPKGWLLEDVYENDAILGGERQLYESNGPLYPTLTEPF